MNLLLALVLAAATTTSATSPTSSPVFTDGPTSSPTQFSSPTSSPTQFSSPTSSPTQHLSPTSSPSEYEEITLAPSNRLRTKAPNMRPAKTVYPSRSPSWPTHRPTRYPSTYDEYDAPAADLFEEQDALEYETQPAGNNARALSSLEEDDPDAMSADEMHNIRPAEAHLVDVDPALLGDEMQSIEPANFEE